MKGEVMSSTKQQLKAGSTHDAKTNLARIATALGVELQTLIRNVGGLNATIGRISKLVEACDCVNVQDTHVR